MLFRSQESISRRTRTSGAVGAAAALLLALTDISLQVRDVARHLTVVALHDEEHVSPRAVALACLAVVVIVAERLGGVMARVNVAIGCDRGRRWRCRRCCWRWRWRRRCWRWRKILAIAILRAFGGPAGVAMASTSTTRIVATAIQCAPFTPAACRVCWWGWWRGCQWSCRSCMWGRQ